MSPLFDFECTNCKSRVNDVLITKPHHENTSMACPQCKKIGSLRKLPPRANFSIQGFNAKNGYSSGGR